MMKPATKLKPYQWVLLSVTAFVLIPGPFIAATVLIARIPDAGAIELLLVSALTFGTYGWLIGGNDRNIEWLLYWWRK